MIVVDAGMGSGVSKAPLVPVLGETPSGSVIDEEASARSHFTDAPDSQLSARARIMETPRTGAEEFPFANFPASASKGLPGVGMLQVGPSVEADMESNACDNAMDRPADMAVDCVGDPDAGVVGSQCSVVGDGILPDSARRSSSGRWSSPDSF